MQGAADDEIIKIDGAHTHDSDLMLLLRRWTQLRENAAAIFALPNKDAIARKVQRDRMKELKGALSILSRLNTLGVASRLCPV